MTNHLMKRLLRWLLVASAMGMLCSLGTSCRVVAPILLQPPAKMNVETTIPAKLGIDSIEKVGGTQVSSCGFFIFPAYIIEAKMPRRNELDYVSQTVADHMNDYSTFANAYTAPYNPEHVQVVMKLKFQELDYSNAGVYATIISSVPYLNLLPIFGVPQDRFTSKMRVTCILARPDGQEIKSYAYESRASDWVTIYEQPYGNYMFYESIFRDEFASMMQHFMAEMEKDKAQILAATR